ncbi:MAG: hypothetical protein Unbinned4162contig1001_27 [Prokaryotic dsDNA virus sp.]|nr:MAG: hypothetical protein Unbinned4162contig1001_27 [Prokaryotic dsDNA virus sp.]|tara:strand:- start:9497 stop:9748 length:252 start_codon:yes stop_codon:yes gene_type:complete
MINTKTLSNIFTTTSLSAFAFYNAFEILKAMSQDNFAIVLIWPELILMVISFLLVVFLLTPYIEQEDYERTCQSTHDETDSAD